MSFPEKPADLFFLLAELNLLCHSPETACKPGVTSKPPQSLPGILQQERDPRQSTARSNDTGTTSAITPRQEFTINGLGVAVLLFKCPACRKQFGVSGVEEYTPTFPGLLKVAWVRLNDFWDIFMNSTRKLLILGPWYARNG